MVKIADVQIADVRRQGVKAVGVEEGWVRQSGREGEASEKDHQ